MSEANQKYLLVVSGPSGSGKNTVVEELLRSHPGGIEESVSATTRVPRQGEVDGVHYHFITKEQFEQNIADEKLLEYASYVGNYYGTLKDEVNRRIAKGIICVLVIEVQGATRVKELYPGCTTVFILPPSMEELERRIRKRGTEGDAEIEGRLRRAMEEMDYQNDYDYKIVNDDPARCAAEIYDILMKRQN